VKGIGENGSIGAPPTIVHAVLDALAPFGIGHLDMPLTSQKIWPRSRALVRNKIVTPAKAGAQGRQCRSLLPLDSRFRGNDGRAEI
jgi:hypothetical protein